MGEEIENPGCEITPSFLKTGQQFDKRLQDQKQKLGKNKKSQLGFDGLRCLCCHDSKCFCKDVAQGQKGPRDCSCSLHVFSKRKRDFCVIKVRFRIGEPWADPLSLIVLANVAVQGTMRTSHNSKNQGLSLQTGLFYWLDSGQNLRMTFDFTLQEANNAQGLSSAIGRDHQAIQPGI